MTIIDIDRYFEKNIEELDRYNLDLEEARKVLEARVAAAREALLAEMPHLRSRETETA